MLSHNFWPFVLNAFVAWVFLAFLILIYVHKIVQKVWETKHFPAGWAAAFIKLLPKSQKLTEPNEFRPIALTNTVSKIFLSVVGRRLELFMVKNGYISPVQKGFKADTPGC